MITLTLALASLQPAIAPAIVPLPVKMDVRQGEFRIGPTTHIAAYGEAENLGEMLRDQLRPATGFRLPVGRRDGDDSISLSIDHRLTKLGAEGYELDVSPKRVQIRAAAPAGVFYGMQTVRQLLPPAIYRQSLVSNGAWMMPCLHIEDQPRFGWRGSHVDVARHFMPKNAILRHLDNMAIHKLNVFHWHLVDNNGWRIEIKRYPLLTRVGSGSDFSADNPKEATRSRNQKPGGFYTQDDVAEVVRYAADRFITIVPEIEMPGHSAAAIMAYQDLGNKKQIADLGGDASFIGTDDVYNVDDDTIAFLKNVLDEVLALFPGKFIHLGGDEVWKDPWKRNPRAQQRMKLADLKNEDELQSWFIRQFDDYLTSKGRRLIGWDEILEGGLAPGAAVMSWRGINGGIAAAKQGHDVVMAPGSHTYLDHYQSENTKNEPLAIGGYLPLETIYAYEPIPSELTPDEAKHVLGAQAQLWSEFIPDPHHLEYMAFPRLCALAELAWSPKSARNYADFLQRLKVHLERLKIRDVNFRPLTEGN